MKVKDVFLKTLKKVNREGIDNVIQMLENLGFFNAPASIKFHGNYPGGLAEHSINVYEQAMYIWKIEQKVRPEAVSDITEENIIISALLHDICKSELYKPVKKWKKDDENNKWFQYDTYEKVYSDFPFGHGEKSVIRLLNCGFKLTESEMLAIRWHMGGFDISEYQDSRKCFDSAADKSSLVAIIVSADWLATRIKEKEIIQNDSGTTE